MFVFLFVCVSFMSPTFLTGSNLINVLMQNAIIGLLAIGQTMVILTGGIDLSVGATLALTTMVSAMSAAWGLLPSLILGLATGMIIGMLNGFLVAKVKMVPFIVTLATMGIGRGIAALMTNGTHQMTDAYRFVSDWYVGPIPCVVVTWLVVTLLFQWLLKRNTTIRHMLAVGGDEETAHLAGVATQRTKFLAYTLSGALSSLGAFFYLSRLGHGYYAIGSSYNMDSIAAVIIGGTSVFGGKGSFVGTMFGLLILGVLENIINLTNMSVYMKDAFKGVIILAIILFNVTRRNRQLRSKKL